MTVPPDAGVLLTIGLAFIAGVVWLVRIEGNVKRHDERIGTITDDVKHIRSTTDKIARSVARLEGRAGIDNDRGSS